jgi:hypothetical protein
MRLRNNWPPAQRADDPEGIMEYWNNGIMGGLKGSFII